MQNWNLLYINSFMRSGSTLLGTLLAEARAIRYLGELRNLEKFVAGRMACACGATVEECPYWGRVLKSMGAEFNRATLTAGSGGISHYILKALTMMPKGKSVSFRLGRYLNQMDVRSVLNIGKVLDSAFNVERVNYFCDSSHRNLQAALMHQAFPGRVKIIRLVRDGRDVCCSVRRRHGDAIWRTAIRWRRFNEYSDRLVKGLPDGTSIRIRYEDLCTDKENELNRIQVFLGNHSGDTERLDEVLGDHHLGGSPGVQLGTRLTGTNIGRWRKKFSERDEKQFRWLAERYNSKLGYR